MTPNQEPMKEKQAESVEIQRYTQPVMSIPHIENGFEAKEVKLIPTKNGKYVLWEDHCCELNRIKQKLESERKRADEAEEKLKEAIEIGVYQAQEWDRFWSAMGCLSKDISVDDAIQKYKSLESKLAEAEEKIKKLIEAQDNAWGCFDKKGTIDALARNLKESQDRINELESYFKSSYEQSDAYNKIILMKKINTLIKELDIKDAKLSELREIIRKKDEIINDVLKSNSHIVEDIKTALEIKEKEV